MKTISTIVIAWTVSLGACASSPRARLSDEIAALPETSARISQNQIVLRALGSSPFSVNVREDLRVATAWLERTEGLNAQQAPDGARVALLLDAIEGQLVMLKTYFDRLAAEEASGISQPPLTGPQGELH